MKRVATKAFSCTIFAVYFFAFILLSQPIQAANIVTITVGGVPYDVAITPDSKYAYVPNGKNVTVIDTATNSIITTIVVGNDPYGVAITPDGKYAYVTNSNSREQDGGTVSVINIATNTVIATIPVGGTPFDVAITPNGEYVYVANTGKGLVSSKTEISPDGKTITVTGIGDYSVSVISTATNTVMTKIPVGTQLRGGIAITPNGEYAYVARGDGVVSMISTATDTVDANITVGALGDIAITPNGEYVYITNTINGSIAVIKTATNAVTKTIIGLSCPNGVAITPDGAYAYVTNGWNDSVSVINTATNSVERTLTVGKTPYGIAIAPSGKYACVTNLAYVATDSPAVNWVGTVSIISTDPSITPTDSISPETPTQLLIIIIGVIVIVVLSLLIIAKKTGNPQTSAIKVARILALNNSAKRLFHNLGGNNGNNK